MSLHLSLLANTHTMKSILLFTCLTSCLLTLTSAAADDGKEVQAAKPPNILFIFADDMSFETIGAVGKTPCKTPSLDKLMESGTHFSSTYNMGSWSGAVCVASRSMLNSGCFVNRAQAGVTKYPLWSEMMRGAGYKTYMTGKWHVPGSKPPFDVLKDVRGGMPRCKGGYDRPKDMDDYLNGWKPWDKSLGGFWEGGTHWSEVVANNSIEFIEQASKDDQPFFMYLAFNATHDPRQSPKEYIDMYPLESMKVPKNYLPEYPYKDAIGCTKGLRDEKLAPFPRTELAIKVHRQEYFALVSHMDAQIGRILEALKKSGQADNTIVIFTADHGLSVGHHGLLGKQNMYDHSMRVPFFISGPGIKPGVDNKTPIYLQDAMATTLDLAKTEKPEHVEFKSLLPLLKGENETHYDLIYGKYLNKQRMITKGDYKLIIYPTAKKMRLFNTAKDSEEMNDLIDNPEYAPKVAELKADFLKLQKSMGDDLDIDNPKPSKRKKKNH